MGKYILGVSDFFLNEAAMSIASDWPENWQDMPEWARLQEIGFSDATTPQMSKNGNILLMNNTIPQYPGGITLQQSGYIRNKLASSGYIRKFERGFTLKQMFDYLIERFSKLSGKGLERTEAHGNLSESAIIFLNKVVNGPWRFNQETQRIDTDGQVNLSLIKSVPEGIGFGVIGGDFICNGMGLTNLDIAPTEVIGNFDCSSNNLTTLDGGPQRVGGNYICSLNKLTTLDGAPEYIIGSFICNSNKLTTLDGCPRSVGVRFDCSKNPLLSFEGAPDMSATHGQFFAERTLVKDLNGLPPVGMVDIPGCKNLTSLAGMPTSVHSIRLKGLSIWCSDHSNNKFANTTPISLIYKGILRMLNNRDKILADVSAANEVPALRQGEYEIHITIDRWYSTLREREKSISIFATMLDNETLDKYFTDNPMNLDLLDDVPGIKAGVLKRTGMRDVSKIARSMRRGII